MKWKSYIFPKILNTNVRSLCNKVDELESVLKLNNIDIAILTETWTTEEVDDDMINVNGYNMVRNDRQGRRGGGVAILVKENWICTIYGDH